ncbi:MAG: transcription-repair coupling factor [Thermoguttaceae bacterium]|nr:transcription-repair coupling factor [Thermoguttaceae bacterium]
MSTTCKAVAELRHLVHLLRDSAPRDLLADCLSGKGEVHVDGVWGSSSALVTAVLRELDFRPIVVVLPTPDEAENFVDDLALFTSGHIYRFVPWEKPAGERTLRDEAFSQRLQVLEALGSDDPPDFVVASIQALAQPVHAPYELRQARVTFEVGQVLDLENFRERLGQHGFVGVPVVQWPGEFSIRGCIVDIFAPNSPQPVRLELWDDQIESIRTFDLASQRSVSRQDRITISLIGLDKPETASLCHHLPAEAVVVLVEPARTREEHRLFLERQDSPQGLFSFGSLAERISQFGRACLWTFAPAVYGPTWKVRAGSVERLSGQMDRVCSEIDEIAGSQEVYLVCETEAEITRLGELFARSQLAGDGRLHWVLGKLHQGFRLVDANICVLSAGELLSRQEIRRPVTRLPSEPIDSFAELREGDLVVHVAYGIARYRGIRLLRKGEYQEEHLVLEFADETLLYVPASKISLVHKYLGPRKRRPPLSKLGGVKWERQKKEALAAVTDFAAELLELQAIRATQPGIAFPPDSEWQQLFDASFPFPETPDQLKAIGEIKADMCRPRPMDRLLCGDVGFGKTELAMRAAFKAVDAGYQVAVLVPTTVLAEQHYRTFTSRMAAFPFRIAMLSRFVPPKEQKRIIEELAAGTIDIVIGTHRLASKDVQFHNLGLLIIDEEQRFGVELKERLKSLRKTVDVLTMTATPIPRTLHMALIGLRDISALHTPPQDRLAVETCVVRFDPKIIRHAVLRELSRQGQVFFIHNRVFDIYEMAAQLQVIVPEARIAVAHAKMPDDELEEVMLDFLRHKYDMLVATTIVENGLDIPTVNTIFINEADRYGLADLHQLRGRVGRYKYRAYCYLLLDPGKPITPQAARRLRAIEEYSELGAGFHIAMRDLEIRGVGNILGREQSGHIARVGYELYCQLLEQAVRQLKNLPPKPQFDVEINLPCSAFLPKSYVSDLRTKVDLYRQLAKVSTEEELAQLRETVVDRFGPLPPEAVNLFQVAELRLAAQRWAICSIRIEDQFVVFRYLIRALVEELVRRSGGRLRIVDQRSAYLPLPRGVLKGPGLLRELKHFLRPAETS